MSQPEENALQVKDYPQHDILISGATLRALPDRELMETVNLGQVMVKGKTAQEIAQLPKESLLEEVGIPLTPIRLKCALLGLGVLKVALHRAKGTPLPEEWAGLDELELK